MPVSFWLATGVRRWMTLVLVSLLSVVLLVGGFPTDVHAAPGPVKRVSVRDAGVEPTGTGLVRPNFVSAAVTARASGERVEVLSERSGWSRSWVEPEGGVTVETLLDDVRFRDGAAESTDGWRDIDTTLQKNADGSWSPRAVRDATVLVGGGKGSLITRDERSGGRLVVDPIPGAVWPEPGVEGSTATYPEVRPGVDVRVTVRPSGFEFVWVVKSRQAAEGFLRSQGRARGAVALVRSGQGRPVVAGRGVEFGQGRGRFGTPLVWDAAVTEAGDPAQVVEAQFAVAEGADPGVSELAVEVPNAWWDDPARVWPVTIDPVYASLTSTPNFDTYVSTAYANTDLSTQTNVRIGFDGTNKQRTWLNFDTSPMYGKQITSATLQLWNYQSWTCSATTWTAYDASPASTSSRWASMPWSGGPIGSSTQTRGSGCSSGSGWVSADIPSWIQAWADNRWGVRGIMVASNEATAAGHKKFNATEGGNGPRLVWSYNRAPDLPLDWAAPEPGTQLAGGAWYAPTTQPTVRFRVGNDPDGDPVYGDAYFSASSAYPNVTSGWCNSFGSVGFTSGGAWHSCTSPQSWAPDTIVYAWVRTSDDRATSAWFGPQPIRIASGKPAAAQVSCTVGNGTWSPSTPSSAVSCEVKAPGSGFSAPNRVRYSLDGAAPVEVTIPQSTDANVAKTTIAVPSTPGGHSLKAWAVGPAGVTSDEVVYGFGFGTAGLQFPTQGSAVTTTDRIRVEATAPKAAGSGGLPTASVQWRVAGRTDAAGWAAMPAGSATVAVAADPTNPAGVRASGLVDTSTLVGATDGNGMKVPTRQGVRLEFRVGFAYPGSAVWTQAGSVQRVPHAFGKGFPEDSAGPGKVALWTGEFAITDTDAELAAPGASLGVSRSHASFAGPAAPHNAVFGPGWVASFDANDDTGLSAATVVDATHTDGTISLVDGEGDSLVFLTPEQVVDGEPVAGIQRSTAALPTGEYVPADDATEQAGVRLSVTGSGITTELKATSDTGVITRFTTTTAPTARQATIFRPADVSDPAIAGKTTYTYDTVGRVTAITAPLPDGVSTCEPGTYTLGCRVLKITYATATTATATPGDYAGQVKQVTAQVNTDPDRVLANYAYDQAGRLVKVTDTRTGLATSYGWQGTQESLRLAGLTPPGQDPFTFEYSSNKLVKVTRPHPGSAGGGTAQVAAFAYDVPLTATVTDLPNVAQMVQRWSQHSSPTHLYASFGQDALITGTPAAGDAAWRKANLQFTDDQGYTVNTATFGAGAWQFTAADYDAHDNIIRAWDQRATLALRTDPLLDKYQTATLTTYNTDITDNTGKVLTPAGTLVLSVKSPTHEVASGGQVKSLRTTTTTRYDESAPNGGINPISGQPYRLPTTIVVTAEDVTGATVETLSTTLTGYEAIEAGDKTGWELGQATTTTTDMNGNGIADPTDITRRTRYDGQGRIIEQRQPSNTAIATRQTRYYTAATTADSCGSKPEYAGWECTIGPKAQPAGTPVPVTTNTAYTWDGQTRTSIETSATVTSTTTTEFDAQDRPVTSTTTVTGLASSVPVPTVTTTYDPATGLKTGTTSTAGQQSWAHDTWGRETKYTNTVTGQPADWSQTSYDATGRVTRINDSAGGQTDYTYDGTDATGKIEARGLVTRLETRATSTGTVYTTLGAYDAGAALITEKLPAGITRQTSLDRVGTLRSMAYTGPANGQPDQPWFGWGSITNAQGQIVAEATPTSGGNAYQGTSVKAIATDIAYTYDKGGRLTNVTDKSGNLVNNQFLPTSCQTRQYTFDNNGNRTSQTTRTSGSDGTCPTSGGTTINRTYDPYDRPTTGANNTGTYTYDPLGRQLTIPSTDAPNPAAGNINLTYYNTDAAASITQGTTQHTFTLDGAGRRAQQTTKTNGTTTATLERHYTDTSDNPAWSLDTRTGQQGVLTRYLETLAGDLGLTITNNTNAELALNTPRGDVVTTITIPTTGNTTGINTWNQYTEYGQAKQPTTTTPGSTTGIGYNWLGTKQRATLDIGITLMGARLYNQTTALFTSLDPQYQGGDTPYGYPNDPINKTDLDGKSWWRAARSWVMRNRGTIATGIATAGCLVPGVGWASCALLQGAAFAVRSEQTLAQDGGALSARAWRKHGRAIVGDGVLTAATFGLGSAWRMAKFGKMGGAFRSGRMKYTEAYARFTGSGNRYSGNFISRGTPGRVRRWLLGGVIGGGTGLSSYGWKRGSARYA